MLLNIRESLKGTVVASVVLIFFIVPLVLTGIGESFLGSAVGTTAATVDGHEIPDMELRRAVAQRKQELLNRENVDPGAEFLKDENLRGPVLESLTQKAALFVSSQNGGMGVSETAVSDMIRDIPGFFVDGEFDQQAYNRILRSYNYTPTSFQAELREDLLISQHQKGVEQSAFSTPQELATLVTLTQQKRGFYTVQLDKALVEKSIEVTDEEIASYYEENKNTFIDEENLMVDYLELSVQEIMSTLDVTEADIQVVYDQELENFKKTEEYDIAHLLLEGGDDQQERVALIQAKLAEGADFAELAKAHSDDIGSRENGGGLGVITPGIFPEAFEQAVYALNEGEVSEPVETDAGIHFIKVITKNVDEPPTFEVRKDAIAEDLKRAEAEEIYVAQLEKFGELAFNAPDLKPVAQELGLKVKSSPRFTRERGIGVADSAEFREVAFSEEVLDKNYNSRVIEVSNDKAIVLKKNEHNPERIKTQEEVQAQIKSTLHKQELQAALEVLSQGVIDKINDGASAEDVAKAADYSYEVFDAASRMESAASFQVTQKVFSMHIAKDSVAFDTVQDRDGNMTVIGLLSVVPGQRSDIKDQQFEGLETQLTLQSARFENSAYVAQIVADADIDLD